MNRENTGERGQRREKRYFCYRARAWNGILSSAIFLTPLISLLFLFLNCNNVSSSSEGSQPVVKELILPSSLLWVNSGVTVETGKRIRVSAGTEALGLPEVFNTDPVPLFGHGGLIGKIGKEGFPFAIGTYKEIQGNSHNHGEVLYLGRNDSTDVASFSIQYTPLDFSVRIEIIDTDAPGLISPRDNAWSQNTLPTFDWDDVDDGIVYTVELSNFPDFRLIEQSLTTTTSYAQTATQVPLPVPGQEQQQQPPTFQPLPEGLHYWRVRAQFNAGRSLSPDFDWTDWSVIYVYGVELGTPPSAPVILRPRGEVKVSEGSSVFVEFIESPDPSGVVWRYWLKSAECGETPQIDTTQDKPRAGWRVFSGTYEVYDPNTPPQLYSAFETGPLQKGNWLLRIEVRDGSDPDGADSSSTDLNINAGCE